MFVLADLSYNVKTPARFLNKNMINEITNALNLKLSDKVLLNVGLGICLFDIQKIGDSYIQPLTGATYTNSDFRYVFFRPFIQELLIGKVIECSDKGLRVSLGFFDDIVIPPIHFPSGSRFEAAEEAWVWLYEQDGVGYEFYIDKGGDIRFRVAKEIFADQNPSSAEPEFSDEDPLAIPGAPYTVVGAINEPGLGLISWWSHITRTG